MGRPAVVPTLLGLRRHPRADRRTLVAHQEKLLRRVVRHAYDRVPYYHQLFDEAGLHPGEVRSVADLARIPITRKADLRARPVEDIVARGYDPRKLFTVQTSGSSGQPFTVYRTWLESTLQYLLRLRALDALGAPFGARTAFVGLNRLGDPRDRKIVGRTMARLGLKRRIMINGVQPADAVADALAAYRPDVILAMSGMLCRVADHLLHTGRPSIRPRVVVVGGEMTTPQMRRQLEAAFRAPVFETYASHEVPVLGWQCRVAGGFHVSDDGVILEVVRNGAAVAPGESGEVVVTNLHAYAMPLVRYQLADVVTRGTDGCACGQPFATIDAIQGRMVDLFPLADGRVISPYEILTRTIRGENWFTQFQLLQERADRVVLRIVPETSPDGERLARIVADTRAFLGPAVEFEIVLVDDLPLEASGKFRPLRSLVSNPTGAGA